MTDVIPTGASGTGLSPPRLPGYLCGAEIHFSFARPRPPAASPAPGTAAGGSHTRHRGATGRGGPGDPARAAAQPTAAAGQAPVPAPGNGTDPPQQLPPFLPRVRHRPQRDGQRDRRDPPFLRSSSSTTWMDSSGSFPGRALRRRSPTGGGWGGPGHQTGRRGRAPKDTLQALVGEERAVLRLPHRHGGQPVLLAVGQRQRAPGRQLLLPRLAVGLQPAGLRSAPGRAEAAPRGTRLTRPGLTPAPSRPARARTPCPGPPALPAAPLPRCRCRAALT